MENEPKNKVIETYADDMAKALKDSEGVAVRQAMNEQEKLEAEKENFSPVSSRNKTFIIVGLILFLLALGALASIVYFKKNLTTPVTAQFVPIIFTDNNEFLEISELNKERISQFILSTARSSEVKIGGVEGIYLAENKNIIGLRRFMTLLEAGLDQNQIGFVSDNFLLGVFKTDPDLGYVGENLFILIQARSFADIFDPLRAWESKMFTDLRGIFGIEITPENKYLQTKGFEDGLVLNKNARILYDNNRNPVMMYVFANDSSVIITDTEYATREVMTRLMSSQVKK